MEIRAVTLFTDPKYDFVLARRFFDACEGAFHVPLQSRRLALPPFPEWLEKLAPSPNHLDDFAASWRDAGAAYISIGPVMQRHDAQWIDRLPALIGRQGTLFASAEIATAGGRIDLARCHDIARVIQAASHSEDGFGNLYFTAIANCPPGSPFFPVAYHEAGSAPAFALALEAADLALTAISAAASLPEAQRNLQTAIESEANRLEQVANELAREHNLTFTGIDFSLAPYPDQARSLGAALEALGLAHLGAPGSLFAAAFITDAIDRARFRRCGFSGLMLPVLEDARLAQRAAGGQLTINDLLAYSAVCGVGLDTIPLPGDIAAETLAAILLDVAALATRLDKPLTARLMPLPSLKAGDPVQFDFPYFAGSRVMSVVAPAPSHLLTTRDALTMQSIHARRSHHVT